MATALEYLSVYQHQTLCDGNDSVEMLIDFLVSYGMTDAAITAICQLIDDEGMAPDFGKHLRENGLVIETDDVRDDDDEVDDLE